MQSKGNEVLARLASLDSCTVSDALDRLHLPGVVLGISAVSGARKLVGRVVTVQLEPAGTAASSSTRHLGTAAVDASGSGDVIVVAHQGRLDVSGWGGILSLGASIRGIEGVIVDGACRDVDESREIGFPIYARAVVPVTARGRVKETAWNVPIQIAGVRVAPGDLVIADGSGVVFVSTVHADAILSIAHHIAEREEAMAKAVRAGRPLAEVMGASYENMAQEHEEEHR